MDDRHSRSSSFPSLIIIIPGPWPEGTGPRHEGYEGASDTRNEPFSRGMLGSDSHPSRGTTSMSDRSETEGAPLLRGSHAIRSTIHIPSSSPPRLVPQLGERK